MSVHKRAVVALSTAVLGAGVALGAPAMADPAPATSVAAVTAPATTTAPHGTLARADADARVSAQARWITLWHGSRNRKFWNTLPVVSRKTVFQVAWRCWNGGDGTKAIMAIERYQYGDWGTVYKSKKLSCSGAMRYSRINDAAVHGTYRAAVDLYGKHHTTEMWLQNYG